MPTIKEKSYAVAGLRLGTQLSTPTGFVLNGAVTDIEQIEHLRSMGYTLTECDGVPKFDEKAVAARERLCRRVVSKDANAQKAANAQTAHEQQFGLGERDA